MTQGIVVAEITENEAAGLAQRPGARPCRGDPLERQVGARIAELRGGEAPSLALAKVGANEWLAYVLDDTPAADSGLFRVTLPDPSNVAPLWS